MSQWLPLQRKIADDETESTKSDGTNSIDNYVVTHMFCPTPPVPRAWRGGACSITGLWEPDLGEIAVTAAFRIEASGPELPGRGGLYGAGDVRCRDSGNGHLHEKVYHASAIGVVESGCFRYRGADREEIAVPGAIVFGNAGEDFSCRHFDGSGNRRSVVVFSDALLTEVAEGVGLDACRFPITLLPPTPRNAPLGAAIRRLTRSEDALGDAAFELAAFALNAGRASPPGPGAPRDAGRVADVIRYLEQHHAEACSLTTLATIAGLSRFHFLRLFRAATGVSPHQFVIALRLRAAAERLRASAEPVTTIALDVGFNDISNFNLLFRRSFGMAPRQWRMRAC